MYMITRGLVYKCCVHAKQTVRSAAVHILVQLSLTIKTIEIVFINYEQMNNNMFNLKYWNY